MKILFISDVYFPRVNGVSTSIETFRHHLREQGHTVHLIAPDYGSASDDEAGITRVPARRIPFDPEDRLMSYRWVIGRVEQLRAERYDILHIQTPFVAHYLGTRLSQRLGIPCVETYHTFFEEYLHHYVPLIPRAVTRLLAKRFSRHQGNRLDGMVVPSHPMLQVLKAYGITTPTEVIPTGMEAGRFVPGDRPGFRRDHAIPPDRPVLLFVGRVAHEKNIEFLLKTVDEVRKTIAGVLLVIAGEGPALESLRHEARRLGLGAHTLFIGYLDRHRALNSCYPRRRRVRVRLAHRDPGSGAAGGPWRKACRWSRPPSWAPATCCARGLGVHIAQEDAADFSAKVMRLLNDSALRETLGAAGRDYAQGWSASRLARRMQEFYQQVLAARGLREDRMAPLGAATRAQPH
jgi:1,2-diacylglycerol 3-alpha-glucosyltransferase